MDYDPELWKKLKPGDRVRVTTLPSFEGHLNEETRLLYEWLISSGHVVAIEKTERIDDESIPWSDSIAKQLDGFEGDYHFLMLNHDGLERAD